MKKKLILIAKILTTLCFLSLLGCDKKEEVRGVTQISQSQKIKLESSSLRVDLKKIAEKLINDKVFEDFDKNYAKMRDNAANHSYDFSKFDKNKFDAKKGKVKNIDDWVKLYEDTGAKGNMKAFIVENMLFMKSRSELCTKYPELQQITSNEFAEIYFICSKNRFNLKKEKKLK